MLLKSIDLTSVAHKLGGGPRKAARMKRTLIALHEIIRHEKSYTATYDKIGKEMIGESPRTARRGVEDCRLGNLIIVKEQKPKPNRYQHAWANIKNIAFDQGLQLQFDFELVFSESDAEDSAGDIVAEENGRPDTPSGQCHESATGQLGSITGQLESATGQLGSITGQLINNARARPPLSPSISPSPPPGGGVEEGIDWDGLRGRLVAYGVTGARQAIKNARSQGWSVSQVLALLKACERKTIGSVQAFGPGAIFSHLRDGEPGSALPQKPSPDYQRAEFERQKEWERHRQAKRTAPKKQPPHPLEHELGYVLDGLTNPQVLELVNAIEPALTFDERNHFMKLIANRKAGQKIGFIRGQLLEALSRQRSSTIERNSP